MVLSDGFGTSAPAVAVRDEGVALPLVTHASHRPRVASLPEGGVALGSSLTSLTLGWLAC